MNCSLCKMRWMHSALHLLLTAWSESCFTSSLLTFTWKLGLYLGQIRNRRCILFLYASSSVLSGEDGAVIPIAYNYWVKVGVITMSWVRILVSVNFLSSFHFLCARKAEIAAPDLVFIQL